MISKIKMMIITTGSELKKIIGETCEYDHENDYCFSNAIILEELFSDQGIRVIPIALAPKDEKDIFKISKSSVVVHPFTPSSDAILIYKKATSKLITPDTTIIK